jgi:hypothetical protein
MESKSMGRTLTDEQLERIIGGSINQIGLLMSSERGNVDLKTGRVVPITYGDMALILAGIVTVMVNGMADSNHVKMTREQKMGMVEDICDIFKESANVLYKPDQKN